MNIGNKESTIRLITGFTLLILTGFVFTPPSLWLVAIFWLISLYLLVTAIFLICPIYKLLGVNNTSN